MKVLIQSILALGILTNLAWAEGPRLVDPQRFLGVCDASAAIAVDHNHFLVADDESNFLRLYHRQMAQPLQAFDINGLLIPEASHPEADIEAVAQLGTTVYWITSHGRNKEGELRRSRYRFFATQIKKIPHGVKLEWIGEAYGNLVKDLIADPQLAKYKFEHAWFRAPKTTAALNIEGLAIGLDKKSLLIGFRNPIPGGRGLILPLLNPHELVMGKGNVHAKFGKPIELNLGGLGVRSLQYWPQRGEYLVVAGAFDDTPDYQLYWWSGLAGDGARQIAKFDFKDYRIEGIALFPGLEDRALLISDDGTYPVQDMECKEVANPLLRSFRGVYFQP